MKTIKEGKAYYFYDERADFNVCKAHVLKILPHPEHDDDRLVVYRWYGKHRRYWWYGITSANKQATYEPVVQETLKYIKKKRECRKCGQCGYYMAYAKSDGTKDHYGDCANVAMNKECNDGINPFNDPGSEILQVDSNKDACLLFKKDRTRRTKEYIKAHPDLYFQGTYFKPLPVR